MQRLRVLLLSTDLERGGLPLRLVRLARLLPTVDVEPVVGCLTRRGPLNDVLESAGIETFACGAAGRFDLRSLATLARHIRRVNPDLVHASLFHANLAARLTSCIDRSRPVITSTVTIEIERRWHRVLEFLTAPMSDLHVANSFAVAAHLRDELSFPADRLEVVLNSVDFDAIERVTPASKESLGLDDMAGLVVWAGRMDPVKNLDAIVDVIGRVSSMRHVNAVLVGDGPERGRIEAMIAARGIGDRIRAIGWRDDVVAILKAADVLLFPSWTEGSPNVVLEAMAAGCPVITSDGAACRELIERAGCGLACHPSDTTGMTAAVEAVLGDIVGARAMAAGAIHRLRRAHEPSVVVGRWRGVYDRVVGKL